MNSARFYLGDVGTWLALTAAPWTGPAAAAVATPGVVP